MKMHDLVSVTAVCTHYDADATFVTALSENGLIEMIVVNEENYVPVSEMSTLEKMLRLHYEMDINLEGIEVIAGLLTQLDEMRQETRKLRNRLELYEHWEEV